MDQNPLSHRNVIDKDDSIFEIIIIYHEQCLRSMFGFPRRFRSVRHMTTGLDNISKPYKIVLTTHK